MSRVPRVAGAVIAAVVLAWFVLGARQAHDTAGALALATPLHIDAATAARARSLLDSAGTLNPDRTVQLLRAKVAFERGQNRQAIAMIEGVGRVEPDNRSVWGLLIGPATKSDSAALRYALARLHYLEPIVTPGLP